MNSIGRFHNRFIIHKGCQPLRLFLKRYPDLEFHFTSINLLAFKSEQHRPNSNKYLMSKDPDKRLRNWNKLAFTEKRNYFQLTEFYRPFSVSSTFYFFLCTLEQFSPIFHSRYSFLFRNNSRVERWKGTQTLGYLLIRLWSMCVHEQLFMKNGMAKAINSKVHHPYRK